MRIVQRRFESISACALIAILLGNAGCGTGEYMKRMEARANQLETAGSFESNLNAESTAVNSDVKLRLPSIFNGESKAWSPSSQDENGRTISLVRLQPSVCTLPGLTTTYERFIAEGEKSFPHYCYFASGPMLENQKPEDFKAQIEAEVAKGGAAGGKFTTVSVAGPTGSTQSWDKLSVTSLQNFAGKQPGGQDISMNGRFDLYFRPVGANYVLVGWRAPVESKSFFDNAERAMGTVP